MPFNFITCIKDISSIPPEISFPRPAWVMLDYLWTGIGLFYSEVHKWGMASMVAGNCGAKKQTAEHKIISCTIYHHPNGDALSDVKNLVT